jgi:hypothetical protein
MLLRKLITRSIVQIAVLGVLLFMSAGTLDWWRAWVLLGVFFVGTVASLFALYPDHKDLRLRGALLARQIAGLRGVYAKSAVPAHSLGLVNPNGLRFLRLADRLGLRFPVGRRTGTGR